jgi:hypothetical protein
MEDILILVQCDLIKRNHIPLAKLQVDDAGTGGTEWKSNDLIFGISKKTARIQRLISPWGNIIILESLFVSHFTDAKQIGMHARRLKNKVSLVIKG